MKEKYYFIIKYFKKIKKIIKNENFLKINLKIKKLKSFEIIKVYKAINLEYFE
jgi:hypothetical protein